MNDIMEEEDVVQEKEKKSRAINDVFLVFIEKKTQGWELFLKQQGVCHQRRKPFLPGGEREEDRIGDPEEDRVGER
jgi:hypothetical protein